jgi:hypothetical protein
VRRDINTFASAERAELVRAYQHALPEQVEAILRDGLESGELASADPRLLSWSFVALVEVVLGDYADRVLPDVSSRLELILNLFFDGAANTGAVDTPDGA